MLIQRWTRDIWISVAESKDKFYFAARPSFQRIVIINSVFSIVQLTQIVALPRPLGLTIIWQVHSLSVIAFPRQFPTFFWKAALEVERNWPLVFEKNHQPKKSLNNLCAIVHGLYIGFHALPSALFASPFIYNSKLHLALCLKIIFVKSSPPNLSSNTGQFPKSVKIQFCWLVNFASFFWSV